MILLDLTPELNEQTGKWEVSETDERGNAIEVYEFPTESAATKFIDAWLTTHA